MEENDVQCILAEPQNATPSNSGDVALLGTSTTPDSQQVTARARSSELISDHDTANLLANEETEETHIRSSSRSSSRSRRRRSRRHHRRRPYFPALKGKETNFLAAFCSMLVLVAMCTALVEPQWFTMYGGGCRDGTGDPISYIGMTQFFSSGKFMPVRHSDEQVTTKTKYIYKFGDTKEQVMYDCVSPKTVQIIHMVLAFCLTIIMFSILAFLLDLAGPSNLSIKILRRNAIFNIGAVLFCVMVNGFCYWITEEMDLIQDATKRHTSSRTEVQFSISFYLVAAAGAMSVIAAACNLMKTEVHHFDMRDPADDSCALDLRHEQLTPNAFVNSPAPPPYVP